MSSIYTWSTDPGSNATADEDINWAEGMPPSAVNNSSRQVMGRVAEYVKDTGGALTAGGTGNALTLTANSAITAYANGQRFVFRATADNTGATTLNINSAGSKAIRKLVGDEDVALSGGEILNGAMYEVLYNSQLNSGSGAWQLINPPAPAARLDYVPTGTLLPYGGTSAPDGYLLCYGQTVSRTTYAALFAIFSTRFGAGDGSTTFTLPDLRGRVIAGQDDMGGTSANRLTGLSGGVDGDTLGAAGGSESHTLTTAQLPAHTHGAGTLATASAGNHNHSISTTLSTDGDGAYLERAGALSTSSMNTGTDGAHTHNITGSTASAGSGDAHNNVQPTIIMNWIVKY